MNRALFALALVGCGAATPGIPTQTDFGRYSIQQGICIEASGTKADTLACLRDTRAQFCADFPAICPTDGGAE